MYDKCSVVQASRQNNLFVLGGNQFNIAYSSFMGFYCLDCLSFVKILNKLIEYPDNEQALLVSAYKQTIMPCKIHNRILMGSNQLLAVLFRPKIP